MPVEDRRARVLLERGVCVGAECEPDAVAPGYRDAEVPADVVEQTSAVGPRYQAAHRGAAVVEGACRARLHDRALREPQRCRRAPQVDLHPADARAIALVARTEIDAKHVAS